MKVLFFSKNRLMLFLCLFCTFTPNIIFAKSDNLTETLSKTFTIGTFPIPEMVIDENTGKFVELVMYLAKQENLKFQIMVYPPKRTVHMFHKGALDGFFPASDKNAGDNCIKSAPIYFKNNIVFLRKGTPCISDVRQLSGMNVGLTFGYTYGEELLSNPLIVLDYAHSDIINIRKLSFGRTDVFIADKKTGIQALKESEVTNVIYCSEKSLEQIPVYFAFQNNKMGSLLAEKISGALEKMRIEGNLE